MMHRGLRAVRWSLLLAAMALAPGAATAAEPDVAGARQLVRDGRYQDAYDLLAPLADRRRDDPAYTYLLGRAALGAKRPSEAKALFERVIALQPESIEAHLGLARAYLALGDYARAKLEFETVLRFEGMPPDLRQQAEIYAAAAEGYEDGKRLLPHAYAAVGVGQYRVNPTVGTRWFGGSDRRDTFYSARVGGGINYELPENWSLDGNLDVRYRYYDNPDSRNDEDVRWRAAVSRAMGESNVIVGVRGRASYRGNGYWRNDFGLFGEWRHKLTPDDQVNFGAEFRRRNYPQGALRDSTHNIGELTASWTRALLGGRASVSLAARAGHEWAGARVDGDNSFWGLSTTLNMTLTERVGAFVFAWWQRDSYNLDRINFAPDFSSLGDRSRSDNLYEVGGGLTWSFAKGWSLNPEILWIRDQSNIYINNYSSTEIFVTLRKDF